MRDFVALFPKEIALLVFGYLEPSDLLKAAQTSRVWRKQAEDDLLWKNKCEEAGLAFRLNSQNEEAFEQDQLFHLLFIDGVVLMF